MNARYTIHFKDLVTKVNSIFKCQRTHWNNILDVQSQNYCYTLLFILHLLLNYCTIKNDVCGLKFCWPMLLDAIYTWIKWKILKYTTCLSLNTTIQTIYDIKHPPSTDLPNLYIRMGYLFNYKIITCFSWQMHSSHFVVFVSERENGHSKFKINSTLTISHKILLVTKDETTIFLANDLNYTLYYKNQKTNHPPHITLKNCP